MKKKYIIISLITFLCIAFFVIIVQIYTASAQPKNHDNIDAIDTSITADNTVPEEQTGFFLPSNGTASDQNPVVYDSIDSSVPAKEASSDDVAGYFIPEE